MSSCTVGMRGIGDTVTDGHSLPSVPDVSSKQWPLESQLWPGSQPAPPGEQSAVHVPSGAQ